MVDCPLDIDFLHPLELLHNLAHHTCQHMQLRELDQRDDLGGVVSLNQWFIDNIVELHGILDVNFDENVGAVLLLTCQRVA